MRADELNAAVAGQRFAIDRLLARAGVDLGDDVLQAEIDREQKLAGLGVDPFVDADLARG